MPDCTVPANGAEWVECGIAELSGFMDVFYTVGSVLIAAVIAFVLFKWAVKIVTAGSNYSGY